MADPKRDRRGTLRSIATERGWGHDAAATRHEPTSTSSLKLPAATPLWGTELLEPHAQVRKSWRITGSDGVSAMLSGNFSG